MDLYKLSSYRFYTDGGHKQTVLGLIAIGVLGNEFSHRGTWDGNVLNIALASSEMQRVEAALITRQISLMGENGIFTLI